MNIRRSALLSSSILTLPIALLACGGPPAPAVTAEVAKPAEPPPPPPVDTSAVPQPAGLVVFGRVSKPSESLKVVGDWTRLPMPGSEVVAEALTGERTGKIIDLEQPIDLAISTDSTKKSGSQLWAVAAGVQSLDAAKSALEPHYKLVPGENGATVISGLGGGGDGDSDDDRPRACAFLPAAGASPVRLVCGSSDAAIHELGPFLARTSPRRTVPSDVHLEAHFAPVRSYIGLGRSMLPGLLSGALGVRRQTDPSALDLIDGFTAEVSDFGTDMENLALDAKLEPASGRLDAKLDFNTSTSLLSRLLTTHADRVDVPPATFWHLPADSDMAFFNRGMDTKDLEHPLSLLLKALTHALEKEGLPDADGNAFESALTHLFITPAPIVFAKGVDFAATQLALDALEAAKDDAARDAAERTAVTDAVGWWMLGLDEPPTRVQGALKELAAAWNRPAIAKLVKGAAKEGKPPVIKIVPSSPALKLPKDTTHLLLTVYPDTGTPAAEHPKKPAPPAKPFNLHVFAVPDAGHVWVAIGLDEAAVAAKARAALAGAPASGTLASRAGLEPIKDARIGSGGFLTLRSVFTGMPDAIPGMHGRHAKKVYAALQGFPEQGSTPIFTMSTPGAAGGDAAAGSFGWNLQVPRPAIEGIVRFIVLGGHF